MKLFTLPIAVVVITGVLTSCSEQVSETHTPANGANSQPSRARATADQANSLSEEIVQKLKRRGIDKAFFMSIRKLMPNECDDYEIIRLLGNEQWPAGSTAQDIANQLIEYRNKINAKLAEAKARTVTVDEGKLRTLLDSSSDKFTAALFGYGSTKAEEYLKLLRDSPDPRSTALADYLMAMEDKGAALVALSKLCKLDGIDAALHYEYANMLLQAGRKQEALAAVKRIQENGYSSAMSSAVDALRTRYLREIAGLSAIQAVDALGVGGLWQDDYITSSRLTSDLLSEARSRANQGDPAAATEYAAAALSVAQQLEDNNGIYERLYSVSNQRRALDQIPENLQQTYLTVDKSEWIQQLDAQKAEYTALEKYYKSLQSSADTTTYERYLALEKENGQVEALRQMKSQADAAFGASAPANVAAPK